jgi:hypothetical protein
MKHGFLEEEKWLNAYTVICEICSNMIRSSQFVVDLEFL